jgi:hypothetical protein
MLDQFLFVWACIAFAICGVSSLLLLVASFTATWDNPFDGLGEYNDAMTHVLVPIGLFIVGNLCLLATIKLFNRCAGND